MNGRQIFEQYAENVNGAFKNNIVVEFKYNDLSPEVQHAYDKLAEQIASREIVNAVTAFQKAAGDTTDHFNVRQFARYTGMQCEELCEKLTAVASGGEHGVDVGLLKLIADLENIGNRFKRGDFDHHFAMMNDHQRKEAFDADIDIVWVSVGSMNSSRVDVHGGVGEVVRANGSKVVDGKVLRDVNGKITKPAGYTPPDLARFVLPK